MSEQSAASCETNVRFVSGSVNRIGSRLACDVIAAPTLSHVARPVAGSKPLTRRVSKPAWNMTFPVARSTPMDGSPESCPTPDGAAKFANVG